MELNSKSSDYSLPPPRYFTPVEKAQSNENDVTHHLVKPTPRHVGVVRPIQYPDRKICHPVVSLASYNVYCCTKYQSYGVIFMVVLIAKLKIIERFFFI